LLLPNLLSMSMQRLNVDGWPGFAASSSAAEACLDCVLRKTLFLPPRNSPSRVFFFSACIPTEQQNLGRLRPAYTFALDCFYYLGCGDLTDSVRLTALSPEASSSLPRLHRPRRPQGCPRSRRSSWTAGTRCPRPSGWTPASGRPPRSRAQVLVYSEWV